jgi:hypothetical protein
MQKNTEHEYTTPGHIWDAESKMVLAFQRGYNDRLRGRDKIVSSHVCAIEHGAYLQGWKMGGKNGQH